MPVSFKCTDIVVDRLPYSHLISRVLNEAPSRGSVQRRRTRIWTCISSPIEHDKNEVYKTVNIDVPIGDLDCGIPNASLCLACFVCYCLR